MVLSFILPNSYFAAFMSLLVLIPWTTHTVAYLSNENLRRQYGKDSKWYEFFIAMFIVEPFLIWVKCKAMVHYLLRSFEGWKPTGKKKSDIHAWSVIIKKRVDILLFSTVILSWFVFNIFMKDGQTIVIQLPAAVMAFGMLSTVLLYGRIDMQLPEDLAKDASIGSLAAAEPTLALYRTAQ
jgi:hypothetical protein